MGEAPKHEVAIRNLEGYIKSSYGWQCHRIYGLRVLCEAAIVVIQKLVSIESQLNDKEADRG